MAVIFDPRNPARGLPNRGRQLGVSGAGANTLVVGNTAVSIGDEFAGGEVLELSPDQVKVRLPSGEEKWVKLTGSERIQPYISGDRLDLLAAVKAGITDPIDYAGWDVKADTITAARDVLVRQAAAEKLEPYKSGDSYNIYKAIEGGVDQQTLEAAFGIKADEYQQYKLVSPYLKVDGNEASLDLQRLLDDLNGTRTSGSSSLDLDVKDERVKQILTRFKGIKLSDADREKLNNLLNNTIRRYQLSDEDKAKLQQYLSGLKIPDSIKNRLPGKDNDELVKAFKDQFGIDVVKQGSSYTIRSDAKPLETTRGLPEGVTDDDIAALTARTTENAQRLAEVRENMVKARVELDEFRKWLQSQPNGYTTTPDESRRYDELQENFAAASEQYKTLDKQQGSLGNMQDYITAYRTGRVETFNLTRDDLDKFLATVDPELSKYITGTGAFDLVGAVDAGVSEDQLRQLGFTADDFSQVAEYQRTKAAWEDVLKVLPDGITTNESIALALQAGLGDQLKVLGVEERDIDSARSWQLLMDKGYINAAGEVDLVKAQKDGLDAQILSAGFTQAQLTEAVQFNQLAARLSPFVGKDGLNLEDAVKAGLTKAEDYAGWNVTQGDIDAAVKFNDEHIQVADQYFLKADIEAMKKDTPELYDILTSKGIDAYNAEIARINAAYEKQMQTLKDLEPFRNPTHDWDYDEKGQQITPQFDLEKAVRSGFDKPALVELYGQEAVDATVKRIEALDKLTEYTDGAGHRIVEFMADKGAKEAVPALLAAGYTSKTVDEAAQLAQALKILREMDSDVPEDALWSGNKEQIEAFKKLYPDYDTTQTPVDKMGRSAELIEKRLGQKIITDMGFLITTSTDLEGELARTAARLGYTYTDKDLGYAVGKRWALLSEDEKKQVAAAYSPETTTGAPLYRVSQTPAKVSKNVEAWIDKNVDAQTQKEIGVVLKTVTKFSPSGVLFFSDKGQKVVGATKDAIINSQDSFAKFASERGGLAKFGTNVGRGIYDLATSLAVLIPIGVIQSSSDMQQGQLGKGLGELSGLGVGFLTWPADVGKKAVIDPVAGSGYAAGLFLGPAAVRRLANSTRTYIDPYGIPKEGISIEYATGRIPVGKFKARWEAGKVGGGDTLVGKSPAVIKEASRQFLIKALQGLTKNPEGTIIQVKYKGVVITGRITPMGAVKEGIAWHGTENMTPYRALKPGQELTVSPRGMYFDPFAAPRFLAGGAGGRPIVDPGYVMLLTEPARIKYLADNPGVGRTVPPPGMYSPGSVYQGNVETQIIAAPESKLTRPVKPNLRQRLTRGKATEFFTTYTGPDVPGLSNGQLVPISVLLDKGIEGVKVPTPKELYAMKLAILRTALTDFGTALKHPGRTIQDIITRRIGPPGVRDADISFYMEKLEKKFDAEVAELKKNPPPEQFVLTNKHKGDVPEGKVMVLKKYDIDSSDTGLTVIGDLHANYKNLLDDINAGYKKPVISGDSNNINTWRWTGKKQTIVQTGDIVDRGREYFKMRERFNKIAEQAKKTNGKFVRLLGNHELAYVQNHKIKGVKYYDFDKVRETILRDIKDGYIQVAFAENGELFTHAGVSLDRFPEYKGKTAEFIASDLNQRFNKAMESGDLRKDPIFWAGKKEGRKGTGGIFWMRASESSPVGLDLGFRQYVGHSPKVGGIEETFPNFVSVDVGLNRDFNALFTGKSKVYQRTPYAETVLEAEAFARVAEKILEETLKENPEIMKEYDTPAGRRKFEQSYRSALDRAFRAWAATRRQVGVREALPREAERSTRAQEVLTRRAAESREAARPASERRKLVERELVRQANERMSDRRREIVRPTLGRPWAERRPIADRAYPSRYIAERGLEPARATPRRGVTPERVQPRPPVRNPPPPVKPPPPRVPPPLPPPQRYGARRGKLKTNAEGRRKRGTGKIAWRQGSLKVGGKLKPVWLTISTDKSTRRRGADKIKPKYSLAPPDDAEILKRTPRETAYAKGTEYLPKSALVGMGAFDVKILPDGTPKLKFRRSRG